MRRCLVVSCSAIAEPPRAGIWCRLMNRTLAAPMGGSKHQFDVVEEVDSEQVFGQDGGMIEQVFPATGGMAGGTVREIGRVRLTPRGRTLARVLATVLVVAVFLLVAPGLARGDGPDRPAPRV